MKPKLFQVVSIALLLIAAVYLVTWAKCSRNANAVIERNVSLPRPRPYFHSSKTCTESRLSAESEEANVNEHDCTLDYVNLNKVNWDDECLLHIIRTQFLHPPNVKPLQLDRPEKTFHSQGKEDEIIAKILENKVNGVYVEAGVFEGEIYSNTLYFERFLNWRGILIEPSPSQLEILFTKNRNAWIVAAGISPTRYPMKLRFHDNNEYGKIVQSNDRIESINPVRELQFFPFYSILLALDLEDTPIDYFSLDVEGVELDILRSIPWTKVDIKTLTVEYKHNKEPPKNMAAFMESHNYLIASVIDDVVQDFVFVKN